MSTLYRGAKKQEEQNVHLRSLCYAAVFPSIVLTLLIVKLPGIHITHREDASYLPLIAMAILAGVGVFLIFFVLSVVKMGRERRESKIARER